MLPLALPPFLQYQRFSDRPFCWSTRWWTGWLRKRMVPELSGTPPAATFEFYRSSSPNGRMERLRLYLTVPSAGTDLAAIQIYTDPPQNPLDSPTHPLSSFSMYFPLASGCCSRFVELNGELFFAASLLAYNFRSPIRQRKGKKRNRIIRAFLGGTVFGRFLGPPRFMHPCLPTSATSNTFSVTRGKEHKVWISARCFVLPPHLFLQS